MTSMSAGGVDSARSLRSRRSAAVAVGAMEDLQLGEGRAYVVGGKQIAVFRMTDGTLHATDAVCPHRGGPLADGPFDPVDAEHPAAREAVAATHARIDALLAANGHRTVDSFHRELGHLMWDHCGMERTAEGLRKAVERLPGLREEFWRDVKIVGTGDGFNQSLEKAGRVADFLELAELMCLDALHREESCGGHFRAEHQTPDGEAARDDEHFAYVAAWEFGERPTLHREELDFSYVHPSQRSYK